jgi:hypothetical protein
MNLTWLVEVQDHGGAPITSADVAFFPFDPGASYDLLFRDVRATHAHRANGRYEPTGALAPTEALWMLVVRDAGRSTVIQPLTLRRNANGTFAMSPEGGLALTVTPHAMSVSVGSKTPQGRQVLQVTLHPASEVALVCGFAYEYESSNDFLVFAEGRRERLWRERRLDAGTLVTIFDCGRAKVDTWVRARNAGGWLRVFEAKRPRGALAPPNELKAAAHRRQDATFRYVPQPAQDLSITDLYAHLDDVGRQQPGSVLEVSVFSHSHPGGPILFNTRDYNHPRGARDPDDFDARPKDFLPVNYDGWSSISAALAPEAQWRIWGCRATAQMKQIALVCRARRRLATSAPDLTAFFDVASETTHGTRYRGEVEERLTLGIARREFEENFHAGYPAAVVSALAIDVWAAPPGLGAQYKQVEGLWRMEVSGHDDFTAYVRGEFPGDYTTDSSGYLNYSKLLAGLPPLTEEPFCAEYYRLVQETRPEPRADGSDDNPGSRTLLAFANRKCARWKRSGFRHGVRRAADVVARGASGFLHTLTHVGAGATGPPDEVQVFVQDDGEAFEVERLPGGGFRVLQPLDELP